MNTRAMMKKRQTEIRRAQEHRELARFYNLNSMLGNNWAIFYFIIGARMTGEDAGRRRRVEHLRSPERAQVQDHRGAAGLQLA